MRTVNQEHRQISTKGIQARSKVDSPAICSDWSTESQTSCLGVDPTRTYLAGTRASLIAGGVRAVLYRVIRTLALQDRTQTRWTGHEEPCTLY